MPSGFNTPILFLLFNRPDTTQIVFAQIKKIKPTQLFLAADGPRPFIPREKEKCVEARSVVNQIDWQCDVKTLFREENLGCGRAVSSAIAWFFSHVTEGIILEDDCLPDLSFFPYCQELLAKYRDEEKVKLIGGINFQDGITRGNGSYYFSHYPEIWGWATWRRVWAEYDFEMKDWNEAKAAQLLDGKYKTIEEKKYWLQKFKATKEGKINTWDYQLTYAILKANGIAITPQKNLVKNIGITNQATHVSLHDSKMDLNVQAMTFPLIHPPMMVDEAADHHSFSQVYGRTFSRAFRLVKENGVRRSLLFAAKKLFR